jgi:hypothetical protein
MQVLTNNNKTESKRCFLFQLASMFFLLRNLAFFPTEHIYMYKQSSPYQTCLKAGTSKTGFGHMKIMKEFVGIILFSSKFVFLASR